MALHFKILSGPQEGEVIPLVDQMRVGRAAGGIQLKDQKISSFHALITYDFNHGWVLTDQNSSNGTWYQGQRVDKISLSEGVEFFLGKTHIQVIDAISDDTQQPLVPSKTWFEVLESEITSASWKSLNEPLAMRPFSPIVSLKFRSGIQAQEVLQLGMGPRSFGQSLEDITLFEPGCPEQAFELIPQSKGALFRTRYPKKVLINGKSIQSILLEEGDIITLGNTNIEVSYIQ